MSEQHQNLIPLHDELLKRNAEDVKEIKAELYGIPQRIDALEKSVAQLCKSVAENNRNVVDLLRRLEDKFQTKEMCEICAKSLDKEIQELKDENIEVKGEIIELVKEKDGLKNRLLITFAIFLVQLVVWIFLNHEKFRG